MWHLNNGDEISVLAFRSAPPRPAIGPSDARLPSHGGGRWALAESTDVVTAWTVVKRDVVMCDGHRAALLAHPARGSWRHPGAKHPSDPVARPR